MNDAKALWAAPILAMLSGPGDALNTPQGAGQDEDVFTFNPS